MILSLNDKAYQMDKKRVDNLIRQVKMMYKGKCAIVAIEKDNIVEMRKDEYKTNKELTKAILNWNQKGFRVKYTRGIE